MPPLRRARRRHRPHPRHQLRYSITVRQTTPIRQAIAAIDEDAWTDIVYPDGGLAQVAETRYKGDRLIVRRTLLTLPGRLTRSARRLILHLPVGWPWAAWFALALARLRCVAFAT